MGSEDPLLHLSRAAGLATYLVLWLDVALGLLMGACITLRWLPRWRVSDLHQFTGTLCLGLLATHIGVLVAVRYEPFSIPELLLPFARMTNSLAPLLGVASLYVLVVVVVAAQLRHHIGPQAWRGIHRLGLGAFALALAHGVAAGPDSGAVWTRLLYTASVASLGALLLLRLRRHSPHAAPQPGFNPTLTNR